jgi:hypothetical protein
MPCKMGGTRPVPAGLGRNSRRLRATIALAVRVFSNNLPNPTVREEVQKAVLGAMSASSGDWTVQIHEDQNSPSWHVTIWGPNNFQWAGEFFGPEEQNPLDDDARPGGLGPERKSIAAERSRPPYDEADAAAVVIVKF